MPSFHDVAWEQILPAYLTSAEKSRLRNSLEKFKPEHRNKEFGYNDFYKLNHLDYLIQGDLIYDIRFPFWDSNNRVYLKGYTNAMILTNTCDISFENKRTLNPKECLFVPLIALDEHIVTLKESRFSQTQIDSFVKSLKAQELTNLFYLPKAQKTRKEYIAILDNVFWVATYELQELYDTLEEERFASLNLYGQYLFILKLSHHFCRFPEENDRPGK